MLNDLISRWRREKQIQKQVKSHEKSVAPKDMTKSAG